MSTASRAAVGATQVLSKATAPARRRVSKRTVQSSPTSALSSLISLYHLSPTFVPTADSSKLQQHVTEVLAPAKITKNTPRPHHLIDLVYASHDLDRERIKLDMASTTSSPASASLLGIKLRTQAYQGESFASFPLSSHDNLVYDHQNSFYSNHTLGQEPPLAARVRRVVDTLHGTLAGGRAGLPVLKEQGGKAVEWKEGLRDARTREKERELKEEQEAEAFGKEFN